MSDGPMHAFLVSLWESRNDFSIVNCEEKTRELSRLLYCAVLAEFDHCAKYDPEIDHKLAWCRAVLSDARDLKRDPRRVPRADADLEAMAQYFLKLGPFAPDAVTPDDDDATQMFPR